MRIGITADPEIAVPPLFYGGIERIIDMIVVELLNLGHEVTLFANSKSSVNSQLIPYQSSGNSLKDVLNNSLLINNNRQKFDVVHSFGRLAYLLPIMPTKTPKLMSYQREPTIKQIKRGHLLSRKNSLHFTGCSNYITNQIKPYASAETVYNGVNFNKYTFSAVVATDAPLVFLGRIEPIKGVHLAVEMAIKTGKKLIIAGNIPEFYEPYFNEKIKPFLSDQIQYVGAVNDIQKSEILSKAAALLMPILWDEPFGIVMVEAMACGTPVLGLNRGAVPEVVVSGITGFFCNTVDELTERVTEINSINRLSVLEMAKSRFSAQVITQQYLQQYQQF
ncbi:glycosyl transferase family 1 [Pedobacter kyungheensis]|uniref:Glycosyl transferase family 1 n=1 Tax=Pedobacter kyungheensis TaxID=1069985 RepID=A0A0C1FTK6_9SPHI|nr:glycosyltransferase [Pedobacter kyungheensis]KIA95113.1 glycosyl transferase family 1 [Pedobacter kyungheensis]